MIKLLSHQKGKLNSIVRVSLINMVLSSFLITVGYAHDVAAKVLLERRVILVMAVPEVTTLLSGNRK